MDIKSDIIQQKPHYILLDKNAYVNSIFDIIFLVYDNNNQLSIKINNKLVNNITYDDLNYQKTRNLKLRFCISIYESIDVSSIEPLRNIEILDRATEQTSDTFILTEPTDNEIIEKYINIINNIHHDNLLKQQK